MRFSIFLFSLLLTAQASAYSIWTVTGHGQMFHLFGTIHVLTPDTYPLPEIYDTTLAQCDRLYLEIDTREIADALVLQQVQSVMLLPEGEKLRDQLSKESYEELDKLAKAAGVPLGMIQGLKPWAAVNQLTLIIFQKYGFTAEGLDMTLQARAQAKNIEVLGFESIMWQLDMFDSLAEKYSDDFMAFSTEELDDVPTLVSQLYKQWQNGDYETMYLKAGFDGYPEIEKAILTDRNNAWMKELLKSPLAQTTCAAVGTLHMGGKSGLIEQFKSRGYTVKSH